MSQVEEKRFEYFSGHNYPAIPTSVAVCPKCGAQLVIGDIDDWEIETGRVTEGGLNITCEKEPDIDSKEWREWFNWHYSMPNVDWLPVDAAVYKWFDESYRIGEEDR